MKTTPKHPLLAAALVCTVAFTNAIAQQVPPPSTAQNYPPSQTPGSFNLEGIQKKIQATMGGR